MNWIIMQSKYPCVNIPTCTFNSKRNNCILIQYISFNNNYMIHPSALNQTGWYIMSCLEGDRESQITVGEKGRVNTV